MAAAICKVVGTGSIFDPAGYCMSLHGQMYYVISNLSEEKKSVAEYLQKKQKWTLEDNSVRPGASPDLLYWGTSPGPHVNELWPHILVIQRVHFN